MNWKYRITNTRGIRKSWLYLLNGTLTESHFVGMSWYLQYKPHKTTGTKCYSNLHLQLNPKFVYLQHKQDYYYSTMKFLPAKEYFYSKCAAVLVSVHRTAIQVGRCWARSCMPAAVHSAVLNCQHIGLSSPHWFSFYDFYCVKTPSNKKCFLSHCGQAFSS